MKILLVEDDQFVRTLLQEQIGSEGIEVRSESNVDDALATLKQENFDVIVTDIVMPGKDGGEFMKHIKESGIATPILAITGGVENAQDDYANYADFFADETMIKPLKKDDLIEALKRLSSG